MAEGPPGKGLQRVGTEWDKLETIATAHKASPISRLMKPWDIYTWNFLRKITPLSFSAPKHLASKPKINVLFCSNKRATREP